MYKIIIVLFTCTQILFAHSLKIFVSELENGKIEVYAYFTKSSVCKACEVQVKNADKILAQVLTDNFGKAEILLKQKSVEIVVQASLGHRGQVSFTATQPTEQTKDDNPFIKILIALSVIALIFLLLYNVKRSKN
ncbi:MAG: hypothetical protein IBX44_01960 [Sulfurospirillum sp.]|nr:hypothetical protein [Sulfurospirillum sp.]